MAFAALSLALVLTGCDEADSSPSIARTAERVDGFDLVFDNAKVPASFGLLEVGHAIKANYAYFTYRGRIYRSAGGGSVVIRDVAESPARFIVRETALAQRSGGGTARSLLQVFEKQSGEELARRGLVNGEVEESTGWTGDHAVGFVRKVLHSTQTPNRPWNVADYPPADARVTLAEAEGTGPHPRSDAVADCPGDVRIIRRSSNSTIVVAGRFDFLPSSPLRLAACNGDMLLVVSGAYASDLELDLLTLDGTPVAQGHLRLPLPIDVELANLSGVRIDATGVELVVSVNQALPSLRWAPYRKVSIKARLVPTCSRIENLDERASVPPCADLR